MDALFFTWVEFSNDYGDYEYLPGIEHSGTQNQRLDWLEIKTVGEK